jgi:hypothetical protein
VLDRVYRAVVWQSVDQIHYKLLPLCCKELKTAYGNVIHNDPWGTALLYCASLCTLVFVQRTAVPFLCTDCRVPNGGVTNEAWIEKDLEGVGLSPIGVLSAKLPVETWEDRDAPQSWWLFPSRIGWQVLPNVRLEVAAVSASVLWRRSGGQFLFRVNLHLQVLHSFPKFVEYNSEGNTTISRCLSTPEERQKQENSVPLSVVEFPV